MQLSRARDAYDLFSGKVSEITRSLCFAALAVAWIFKVGEGANAQPTIDFLGVVVLAVAALFCDLLQYVVSTIVWGVFHRLQERKIGDTKVDKDVYASPFLNWPGLGFFWFKVLFLCLAYWELTKAVLSRWRG